MNAIRAAAVQFNHRPGDKDANIETVNHFVKEAAAQQVDFHVARRKRGWWRRGGRAWAADREV